MKAVSLLISLIFVFSLSSCGNKPEPTAPELMASLESLFSEPMPAARYTYKKSASEFSPEYLNMSLASVIYYGEKREDVYELSLCSDYAVRLADGECPFEIHIFKVRALSDKDTVVKMLKRRLDFIKTRSVHLYVPDDYEKYASGAGVYSVGKYVFLLATGNNDEVISICKDLI